jgi:hypothetical protein
LALQPGQLGQPELQRRPVTAGGGTELDPDGEGANRLEKL